jgi:predicted component of type VI protein secretion system
MTLGREAINDIPLADPEVSRRHARITYQEGRYVLEDLGSTNGTFINGRRIANPTFLNEGDIIDVGELFSFTFQGGAGDLGATFLEPLATDADKATEILPGSPVYDDAIPGLSYDQEPAVSASPPAQQEFGAQSQPQESLPPPPLPTRNNRRMIFLGCGCLFFLVIFACAASLFLADSLFPDVLYCGPGRALFELAGLGLSCT